MIDQAVAKPAPLVNRTAQAAGQHQSLPFISWRPGGVRRLYFLTPFDEIAQVRLHSHVRQLCGGHERWLAFMCRKDPAWLPESGGSCELCDRIGHVARERFVALAVELEAEHKSLAKGVLSKKIIRVFPKTREVLDEEGHKVDQPRIGLVAQAAYNFFTPLAALHRTHPVEQHTFEILREGTGKHTRFLFGGPRQLVPDLEALRASVPDLADEMEELGSAERFARELAHVQPEDQPEYARATSACAGNPAGTNRGPTCQQERRLSSANSPVDFLEFIWSGQDGWFELASEPNKREYFPKEEALRSLDKKRFFAPLARKYQGSTKAQVADYGNVLWADIDSLEGLDRIEDRLVPLGIVPSAIVFSGMKGFWVYLKLSSAVSTLEIEQLNKGLAAVLEADNCWNCDRLARLPGSVHQISGKFAEVIELAATTYTPAELAFLAGQVVQPAISNSTGGSTVRRAPVQFPGFPRLSGSLWAYIKERPEWRQGYDRSREEQRILLALVTQGWTDDEIIGFADTYRLSRHEEEVVERLKYYGHREGGDNADETEDDDIYEWSLRSLRKARGYSAAMQIPTILSPSTNTGMCMRSVHYHHTPREDMLRCVDGQSTIDLVHEIVARTGCSVKTARRGIKQLEAKDFIIRQKIGRVVFNHLTPKALEWFDMRFKPDLWLPSVRKRAG